MQLDKFTDYGLRVLIYLRLCAPRRASVSEIAARFELSEHHLSKVATTLAAEGFVTSSRGRTGGLALAMRPEDIRVGAVVRRLTRTLAVAECFATKRACVINPSCGLKPALAEAQVAFFAVLDGYSLADVSQQHAGLAQLLELETALDVDGAPRL